MPLLRIRGLFLTILPGPSILWQGIYNWGGGGLAGKGFASKLVTSIYSDSRELRWRMGDENSFIVWSFFLKWPGPEVKAGCPIFQQLV